MEYFDILDRDGSRSGKIAPKDEELLERQVKRLLLERYMKN